MTPNEHVHLLLLLKRYEEAAISFAQESIVGESPAIVETARKLYEARREILLSWIVSNGR